MHDKVETIGLEQMLDDADVAYAALWKSTRRASIRSAILARFPA